MACIHVANCHGANMVLRVGKRGSTGVKLQGAKAPTGLAVDEAGRILVSDNGRTVQFDRSGIRIAASAFAGLPAPGLIRISQGATNFDPKDVRRPEYTNVLPDEPGPTGR
jgi:hypothetical protein